MRIKFIMLLLVFCLLPFNLVFASEVETEKKVEAIGDDIPVSRALVAKMLSLSHSDLATIETYDREINFSDTSYDKWYDKFINAAYINKLMQGDGDKFMPDSPVTLKQAKILIEKLDTKNKVKIKLTDETQNKPISYALWVSLYKQYLVNISNGKSLKEVFDIDEKVFVVLATPDNNKMLKQYNMITDKGPLSYAGLNMKPYIDKSIRALVKDNEVIAILKVEELSPTIKNAYIVKNDSENITIFSGGTEREYSFKNSLPNSAGKICDIKISSENAVDVTVYDETISDVVKLIDSKGIEFFKQGTLPVSGDLKVYSTIDNNVKWKNINDFVVGQNLGSFFVNNGKIEAVIIDKAPKTDKIRVAINNTGYKSLYHNNVTITSKQGLKVKIGDKNVAFNKSTIADFSKLLPTKNARAYVVSDAGTLQITSIKRDWQKNESPYYRGVLEIIKTDSGYVIVNELGVDEYLYGVVPSEMITSYGVEAAKVQAITARSYAKNQIIANRFHKYGATVDDSVSSQVYLRIPETDISIKGVDYTKGKCLVYENKPISANFFSTSSGFTANNGEVWADDYTKQFPTFTKPYLKSVNQSQTSTENLSLEENMSKFIKDKNIQSFDASFPWYRWQVKMNVDEISASINANIKARYDANPKLIKVLQEDNIYRSRPIDNIGNVVDINVLKRGQGGNIMEMTVIGTKATVKIITEYNVRALIRPVQYVKGKNPIVITKKDNTKTNNYSIMPSSFYVFDKQFDANKKLSSLTFFGGGNGHGVGMSQNGVKGMIDKGFRYDEILYHYYPGTNISTID